MNWLNRKYAIRLINSKKEIEVSKNLSKRDRKKTYDDPLPVEVLTDLWTETNLPCSKRFKAIIPLWLPYFDKYILPLKIKPSEADVKMEDKKNEDEAGHEEHADSTEDSEVSDVNEDYHKKLEKLALSNSTVIRKIKVSDFLVTCCPDHYGKDDPECFTQGQIIFINSDHSLYKKESKQRVTHAMYLARLLSQEIALMKNPPDARYAFQRQSELLKNAFSE